MLKQRIPKKKLVETPTPKLYTLFSNVQAKSLGATVSESGRQLQTPKVSVEFPLLAEKKCKFHNGYYSLPPRGFVQTLQRKKTPIRNFQHIIFSVLHTNVKKKNIFLTFFLKLQKFEEIP